MVCHDKRQIRADPREQIILMKIHFFGAAGSGVTTLGQLLSQQLGINHIDVDNLTWDHTSRPFDKRLPRAVRKAQLKAAIGAEPQAVVSGSVCGWGDDLIDKFDIGIFLHVPTAERLRRITLRQTARYGAKAIALGGEHHEQHEELMRWAGLYDYTGHGARSYAQHRQWMRKRKFPILTVKGTACSDKVLDVLSPYLFGKQAMAHRMTLELAIDRPTHGHYTLSTS